MPTLEERVTKIEKFLSSWSSGVEEPAASPLDRYLAGKKLTLPTNKLGQYSGAAAEVFLPELLTYNSKHFLASNEKIIFNCPSSGAVTDTAKYPRIEFRYLKNWKPGENSSDTITYSVDKLPDGGKIVTHQFHRLNGRPLFKEVFGGGKLRVLVKPSEVSADVEIILLEAVKIGDKIESRYDINNGVLSAIINGKAVAAIPVELRHEGYYKSGLYVAHSKTLGDSVVTHYIPQQVSGR